MPTTKEVIADPKFKALPVGEQVKVLDTIDPSFQKLPEAEKGKVMMSLNPQQQEEKGLLSQVGQFAKELPGETLKAGIGILSAPQSFAVGGGRGRATGSFTGDVVESFKEAGKAAYRSAVLGEPTTPTDILKLRTGKTFSESYGTPGAIADLTLDIVADPLIITTIPTATIKALRNAKAAKSLAGERKAVEQVIEEIAKKQPEVAQVIKTKIDDAISTVADVKALPDVSDLPKYAEGINLERIGAEKNVKELILGTSKKYAATMKAAKQGVITHKETVKRADDLLSSIGSTVTPEDLIKSIKTKTDDLDAYMTAGRDWLNSSATRLEKLRLAALESNSDEALARFNIAMKDHAVIQAEVGGASSKVGRALSAHRIASQPTKNYKAMLDSLGGRGVTEDILEKLTRIDSTDQVAVNKFIRETSKAKTTDMVFEAWVNALLSSPTTHIVNTTSNSLVLMSKLPEEGIAAGIDMLRAGITKAPRERYIGEAPHHIFGLWEGVKSGVRKGLEAFKTEMPSQAVSKLEVKQYQAIPGRLGKAARLPGRALTSMDEFFKAVNYESEIHSMAYRQAVKEGLKGPKRAERIGQILADPSEKMVADATQEMLYRVFQKELGSAGKYMQGLRESVPGLRYIVPFLRTPINIAKFGLERTPLYYPSIAKKMFKGELKGGAAADELAKATFGSLIAATTAIYAAEGKITGGGPKDKAEREALYRTGWQPYSFKIGDKYYSYGRLEPLATTVGLVADFKEIRDTMSEGESDDVAAQISLSISKNIINKTFMRGLSDAINAISDPARYGRSWTERFVGTAIPRGVAGVARAIDPTLRRPTTYSEVYKAQIPFLSKGVLPKRDLWGETIQLSEGGLASFSPVKVTEVEPSKIDEEMLRLKIAISLPRDEIHGIELTPEEYDDLIRVSGQWAKKKLDAKVKASSYNRMPDKGKVKMIRTIIFAGRDMARGRMYKKVRRRQSRKQ